MEPDFLIKVKEKIINEKKELVQKASDVEVGDIDSDGDEADEIQSAFILSLTNQMNSRSLDRLNKLNSALDKINKLCYGECEDCGEKISEKRLLIDPCFALCIKCAEELEFQSKQKGSNAR